MEKIFLIADWKSLTKIAGSGAGSVSQRYGSADQDRDLYQNVTDQQHCNRNKNMFQCRTEGLVSYLEQIQWSVRQLEGGEVGRV